MAHDAPGDRYDLLKPPAVLATLRSLGRRSREAVTRDPHLDVAELAQRPGSGGYSIIGLLDAATADVTAHGEAAVLAAHGDRPADPATTRAGAATGDLGRALTRFGAAADAAADALDAVPVSGWARPGVEPLARGAARAGAEAVRALEQLVGELASGTKRARPDH